MLPSAPDDQDTTFTAAGSAPRRGRIVAVVGRPNVGKSALFNRITGRRVAIVHDESGVTRDRIVRRVPWEPAPFDLVDTGGVRLTRGERAEDLIEAGVIEQVEAALTEAAAAILVVDGQTGLHPFDEEVAQMIRRAGVPCCVAVNKCDLPQHEAILPDFAPLGFALYPISAIHGRGVAALLDEITEALPAGETAAADQPLRVAVVGRPNAGKSSYINRILRSQRVIVSEVAGTTRDSIEIPFTIGSGPGARNYLLVDTAGMRHAHRIDNAVERFSLFRAERAVNDADIAVLIMDAVQGPTLQDKHIAALIEKARKGCVLAVNKWDIAMAQGMTQARYEPALREAMPFMKHCPVVFISAQDGFNVRQSLAVIDEVAANVRQVLPTGPLNRVLNQAVARINLPGAGLRRLRVFYATQTGTAPIEIRVFVNDSRLVTSNFTEYLIRALRQSFRLSGAPVVVRYRSRKRPASAETARPAAPGGAPKRPAAPPRGRPKRPAAGGKSRDRRRGGGKSD